MKNIKALATALLFALTVTQGAAAEKVEAGPNGGRFLGTENPRPEFLVEKDRKVKITFFGADKKAVTPDKEVTVIAEAKSGKKTLKMEKKGDSLVSTEALPEGEPYNVVVQVKGASDARPKNFRVPLNLEQCGECKHQEYACVCHE